MFDYGKVDTAINRIIEAVNPKMIIVFGSVARREANDDSDLDVLVVFEGDVDRKAMYPRIKKLFLGLRLASDIVIMSEDDFNHYKENEFSFTHEIVSTGKVVYAQ